METKNCTRCLKELPLAEFYVAKKNGRPIAACRECTKAFNRVRWSQNSDRYKTKQKAYYAANKSTLLPRQAAYSKEHPEIARRAYVKRRLKLGKVPGQPREKLPFPEFRARKRARDYILRNFGWIQQLKSSPCLDCGVSYPPCVMDFDHRDGSDKLLNVGRLRGKPRSLIEAEIAKCDLVCSNCHRLRSQRRIDARIAEEEKALATIEASRRRQAGGDT